MFDRPICLDFDDMLVDDAKAFGLGKAQAGAPVTGTGTGTGTVMQLLPERACERGTQLPSELREMLYMAQEIYGETNSACSQIFCHWVQDLLDGGSSIMETRELWKLVRGNRTNYGAGAYIARIHGREEKAQRMLTRKMAVACAVNTLRMVLNWQLGRDYKQWIERAQYHAVLAEKDVKASTG